MNSEEEYAKNLRKAWKDFNLLWKNKSVGLELRLSFKRDFLYTYSTGIHDISFFIDQPIEITKRIITTY